jgi:molybdopterin-synthase adenylyltransferase
VNQWTVRQSFLGQSSDQVLAATKLGVVGVCGGGSHIATSGVHIGFGEVHLFDADVTESHHGHRMLGVTYKAVDAKQLKVETIREATAEIPSQSNVVCHSTTWEESHLILRSCHLVVSCVDSYLVRDALEKYCRRFLIPLIDIGMDVLPVEAGFQICGQAVASIPGRACMRCFGILRDDLLAREAAKYGAAGGMPQVIWPNAALASTAIAVAMQMLMPWNLNLNYCPYFEYNGNDLTIRPHPRLAHVDEGRCSHFSDVGDPLWKLNA